MTYLILAIISSSLITILMKASEGHVKNNISLLTINYVVCLLLSILFAVFTGNSGMASIAEGAGTNALSLGLINGVFYVGSFLLLQYNIQKNGVMLPATFMKLGVLVPVLIAIIVFGEKPGALQIAGMALAIAAILLLNNNSESNSVVTAPKALIVLLLIGGSGDAMSKIYEELGDAAYKSHFLLFTFLSALICCSLTAILKEQQVTKNEMIYGALIGIPNYFSARFLLLSLSYVPAAVAYPTYSVGTILLVGAAGSLLFHERMESRQYTAVAVIIAALIMLNV